MAMPEPFSGSASGWASTGTSTPKSGVCTVVPKRAGEALVVGVGHQRHAGGEQLGPGGLDLDVVEAQAVVGPGLVAVLHLGLGHGGLVVDVPQGGRFGRVGLAARQVAQEHALAGPPAAVVDGGVAPGPVDRQPEAAPQFLEDLLVLDGQPGAERNEVGPADRDVLLLRLLRRLEVRVVGEARVAAHTEVVLHPALGGQPVVVPAHRVEELPAAHAPVAGQRVGLHVAEDRAHVERARHRRGWGVDGEDVFAARRGVEAVGALVLPDGSPAGLHAIDGGLVRHHRNGCRVGRHDRVTVPGCCTSTTPQRAPCARSSTPDRG